MDCFASLAMTGKFRSVTTTVIPREGGYPVRCSLSVLSSTSLEYRVTRLRGWRQVNVCRRSRDATCARAFPSASSPNRGSRECRVLAAPAVSCADMRKENAHEHTGTAGAVRHSLRNGLTAYAALSLETNSFCLHHRRLDGGSIRLDRMRHRQLGTSHGCRDHTVLPYAATSVILRAVLAHGSPPCEQFSRLTLPASTASRPAFVTTRDPPLLPGRDSAEIAADLGRKGSGIFWREGLDTIWVICPSG
jgi:hypothetical protein